MWQRLCAFKCLTMVVRFSSVMGRRVSTTEMYPRRQAMDRAVFPFWPVTDQQEVIHRKTQRAFGLIDRASSLFVCACVVASVFVHWPRWAHWPRPRAEAAGWWCGCGPAELPGVEECTRSRRRHANSQGERGNTTIYCGKRAQKQQHKTAHLSVHRWVSLCFSTLVLPLTLAWFCSRKFAIFALP